MREGFRHARRTALYTDGEEWVCDVQRPGLLTGVDLDGLRSDLLDRSIAISLPAIPDGRRRTESELWGAFEAVRPRIVGALLDRVAAALKAEPQVTLDEKPRMADSAVWSVAASLDDFLGAYAFQV